MSFSFSFYAQSPADANEILDHHHCPVAVKAFIKQALSGISSDLVVFVEAHGHLCNNDYNVSNATIKVSPVVVQRMERPGEMPPDV